MNVVGLGLLVLLAVLSLYRRFTRISVSHIPGPPSESFALGVCVLFTESVHSYNDVFTQAILLKYSKVKRESLTLNGNVSMET